jgi:hypothetical protein
VVYTMSKDDLDSRVEDLEATFRLAPDRAADYMGSELEPRLDVARIRAVWERKIALLRGSVRLFDEQAVSATAGVPETWGSLLGMDSIGSMPAIADNVILRRALVGRSWSDSQPWQLSLSDFELYRGARPRYPSASTDGISHVRLADQLRDFEAFLVVVYGAAYSGVTTDLQRRLRYREGRFATSPVDFAWIAVHRRVCAWYRDLTQHKSSESYLGCGMKDAVECAELLRRGFGDVDLSLSAQYHFTSYEMAAICHSAPAKKAANKPAPAAAVELPVVKPGDKRPLDDQRSKNRRKRVRAARVAQPSPAHADAVDEPSGGPLALAQGSNGPADGRGGRGGRGGAGRQGPMVKALHGFCLFHLGGLLGVPGKADGSDKPMACFSPAGASCHNGAHSTPSPSVAKAIAADLQAALAPGGPNVAFAPAVKKLFIKGLLQLGAGAN